MSAAGVACIYEHKALLCGYYPDVRSALFLYQELDDGLDLTQVLAKSVLKWCVSADKYMCLVLQGEELQAVGHWSPALLCRLLASDGALGVRRYVHAICSPNVRRNSMCRFVQVGLGGTVAAQTQCAYVRCCVNLISRGGGS
jgi:hypothetical protein